MWAPFITKWSSSKLERRKNTSGGSENGSSGGGESSGSEGSSGSSGSSGSHDGPGGGGQGGGAPGAANNSSVPVIVSTPISTGQGKKNATPFSAGGGPNSTIPPGSLFAGRSIGGGTRDEVYGTRTYGSGYPDNPAGRGVAGLGFPFYFWPLAWGGAETGTAAYLSTDEYGRFDNTSRPGGTIVTASFSSSLGNITYRLVADNVTVTDLIPNLFSICKSSILDISPDSITANSFDDRLPAPRPEQVIQYYRASSAALTLDGYNNTSALGPGSTPDTPLPSNVDMFLLICLNITIGSVIPLVDAGGSITLAAPSTMGLVGLAYLVWSVSSLA